MNPGSGSSYLTYLRGSETGIIAFMAHSSHWNEMRAEVSSFIGGWAMLIPFEFLWSDIHLKIVAVGVKF
jgi:hypothetical protein